MINAANKRGIADIKILEAKIKTAEELDYEKEIAKL
jgi:hypothetical protein